MAEALANSLALFLDFENFALGLTDPRERFDINRVLRRMVEKGKVVVKKAYADWSYYSSYTAPLHEAGFELIDIPRRSQSGKNSADIRLCVDAMDLAYSKEHIDTFVILSGDSDFTPLVSKLKELGKHVIGVGMANATSELLRDNCDEFIYYEDLEHIVSSFRVDPRLPENKRKAFQLLMDALTALRRENKEVLWSSMIKDTMKRLKPSFNETYHGYHSFTDLLEDAERHGLLELEKERRSGTYVVTRFGEEMREDSVSGERIRRRAALHRSRASRLAASRYAEHHVGREYAETSAGISEEASSSDWSVAAERRLGDAAAETAGEPASAAGATHPETTTATPSVPSGPPRIVFTIGEAERRPEPRFEPAYVTPSPTVEEAAPPMTEKPAVSAEPSPSSRGISPLPGGSRPATPEETPPAAPVGPAAATSTPASGTGQSATPTPTTPGRRESRPFGFGVFDTPGNSDN